MRGHLGICSSIDCIGVILRVLSVGPQGWAVGICLCTGCLWRQSASLLLPYFSSDILVPLVTTSGTIRSNCTCYLRGRGRAKLGCPFLVPFHFVFYPHKGKDQQKPAFPLIPEVFGYPLCTPPHSFFGLQAGARGHSAVSTSSSVEGNGTSSPSIDTNTRFNLLPILVSALKN